MYFLNIFFLLFIFGDVYCRIQIRFCVLHNAELTKIKEWNKAIQKSFKDIVIKGVLSDSPIACMQKVKDGQADICNLDGGQVYEAGLKYGLVVVLAETYSDGKTNQAKYKGVAIVKANSHIKSLADLKGLRSCHTGVGRTAGWNIPIGTLLEKGIMEVKDCNNPAKSAAAFFSKSCAPLALDPEKNIDGTNPEKLCAICGGSESSFCNSNDPYWGYHGAFKCLRDGQGDIAFAKGITTIEMTKNKTQPGFRAQDFRLLCLDGRLASIYDSENCFWNQAPAHALMVSPTMPWRQKENIVKWMLKLQEKFGRNSKEFKMFGDSAEKYGKGNLLFKDSTQKLIRPSSEDYKLYLGNYLEVVQGLQKCEPLQVFWCVLPQQLEQCERFSKGVALNALKPGIYCVEAATEDYCLNKVKNSDIFTFTLIQNTDLMDENHKMIFKENADTQHLIALYKDQPGNIQLNESIICLDDKIDISVWDSDLPISINNMKGGSCYRNGKSIPFKCNDISCLKKCVLLTTFDENYSKNTNLKLVCPDGRNEIITKYNSCNFGTIPIRSFVTRKNISPTKITNLFNLFKYAAHLFDGKKKQATDEKYNIHAHETQILIRLGKNGPQFIAY